MSLQQDLHRAHVERRQRIANAAVKSAAERKEHARQTEMAHKARVAEKKQEKIKALNKAKKEADNLIDLALKRLVRNTQSHGVQLRPTSIPRIIRAVAEFYNIPAVDILSDHRTERAVHSRHVAILLARDLTSNSLTRIGKAFRRDHSTVAHAVTRLNKMLAVNERLRDEIQLIKMRLLEVSK